MSKVHVKALSSAPLEKQSTKDIGASNNAPASREKPTVYQTLETSEKPGSNQKSELVELGGRRYISSSLRGLRSPYSEDDGRMDMMERPGITPSRERRRARAYSSTNRYVSSVRNPYQSADIPVKPRTTHLPMLVTLPLRLPRSSPPSRRTMKRYSPVPIGRMSLEIQ